MATGAIKPERFLIDNQRCLSALNEVGQAFPDWLSPDVHHTLYDCLLCQLPCPMNREQLAHVGEPVHFTEEETEYLLRGEPYVDIPPGHQGKSKAAGPFSVVKRPCQKPTRAVQRKMSSTGQ